MIQDSNLRTVIRPSSDLRNSYPEISDYCNSTGKAVFITRNGRNDTVVMSVERYERMEREILLAKIKDGIVSMERGECKSVDETAENIMKELGLRGFCRMHRWRIERTRGGSSRHAVRTRRS